MKSHLPFYLSALLIVFFLNAPHAQHTTLGHPHEHKSGPLDFIENKNQWDESVLFKTNFDGSNTLFIQRHGYTVLMADPADLEKIHLSHKKSASIPKDLPIHYHAYKVEFLGGSPSEGRGIAKRNVYHNYFKGKDQSKWAGHVGLYGKVEQRNIYPGIHLETYSQNGHLKYDLIVAPNADPSKIKLAYTGLDKMELVEGNLHLRTSVGQITEMTPVAYQEVAGERVQVPCYFYLEGNVVSYTFPAGYDRNYELVIDPVIVASTMTGTGTGTNILGNWGHSATNDNAGNIYGAGISFVTTLPTSMGSFQMNWAGGTNDMAIIKYNPDGSQLIWATYIGGIGDDWPHSIITDFNQQVYIYGSTTSSNYPVTTNGFQQNFGGNRDIVVSILSQDGSAMVGSSYFGGTGADGYNENFNLITHSYGDEFRGEIVIDGQNNVYVISSTQSTNFPVTANAYDKTLNSSGNPAQDAVVLKANSDLSFLYWATYLGGNDLDSGNGIRVDDDLNVYVTGTAGGSNFPTTPNTVQPNWPGGEESGYLTKIAANGSTILASTFFGSNSDDNSYFLDIDEDDQVHIFGKTRGTITVTPPGTYSGPTGSSQFLAAFSNDLSTTIYRTVIGNGPVFSSDTNVPVAFMVDKCNGIYLSMYHARQGLPTTPGSFPDAIPGNEDFYMAVLNPNAQGLEYATYYGEADHVDGGTSRFDKGGVIYQGVCSCDWSGNLTTLPNAWATGQDNGCDIGVFKIDLEIDAINANGIALPSTSGCAPYEVDFFFTGTNATVFEWSIDSTVVSTEANHTYTFTDPGTYNVQLAVLNPSACNPRDTFNIEIVILDGNTTSTFQTICLEGSAFLDAGLPGATYTWHDGSTAAGYVATQPGIYWVDLDLGACVRRDSFEVLPNPQIDLNLGDDLTVCDTVVSVMLDATTVGLVSYEWQNGDTNPTLEATTSGLYTMTAIDTSGCTIEDDILIQFVDTPEPDLGVVDTLCDGETIILAPDLQNALPTWQDGSTGNTYQVTSPGEYWLELNNGGCRVSDTINIEYFTPIAANAVANSIICANDCNGSASANPSGGSGVGYTFLWSNGETTANLSELCPGPYTVTITDSRGCTAEATVEVIAPPPLAMVIASEDVECHGDGDGLIQVTNVSGGQGPYTYAFNGSDFTDVNGIGQLSGGEYVVSVLDDLGCSISDTVTVNEPDDFIISAGEDQVIDLGEETNLEAQIVPFTNQVITWSPPDFLECMDCPSPTLCPTQTTLYLLSVSPPNSDCLLTDSVLVTVNKTRRIYIPNVFSPNDDGINDFFTVFSGIGIKEITEFRVFDRWGELVFENYNFQPNDEKLGWDGKLKGKNLNPAVFVYFAKVLFKDDITIMYEGDVNLVR